MAPPWHTTRKTSSQRFDIHLGGLKDEFEQTALEIESLRKDRDELEAKGMEMLSSKYHDSQRWNSRVFETTLFVKRIVAQSQSRDSRVVDASQPKLTTSRSLDTIVAHSKIVDISFPFSPQSASTVYPGSGSRHRGRSIIFNKEVEKALDVELIAHVLSHGKPISCVNFRQDGKHIVAASVDGKVYVYDVKSGNLTW